MLTTFRDTKEIIRNWITMNFYSNKKAIKRKSSWEKDCPRSGTFSVNTILTSCLPQISEKVPFPLKKWVGSFPHLLVPKALYHINLKSRFESREGTCGRRIQELESREGTCGRRILEQGMECLWCNRLMVLVLLACFIQTQATSRSPCGCWDQMLPKIIPSPPSAPSRGTNSAQASSTSTKVDRKFPSRRGWIWWWAAECSDGSLV